MGNEIRPKFLNGKTLIGILISVLGLYIGFRKFDAREFFVSLKQTDLFLFVAAMALMVFTVFLRAWRWRYLLLPLKKMSMKHLFAAEMICYFGNNVFPLRFGEILRCYSLNQMTEVSAVSIFGTVVIERILDMITFFIILLIDIIFFPELPNIIRYIGIVAVIAIFIFGILFYISSLKREIIKQFLYKKMTAFKYSKRIKDLLNRLKIGLTTLRSTPHLGLIVLQSLTIWSICMGIVWIVGISLGTQFSLYETLLIIIVTSAIISIPSAPGYVGTFHAGTIGILVFIGIEMSHAQVIAVMLHAVGFISLTVIGLLYFLRYSIHLNGSRIAEIEKG